MNNAAATIATWLRMLKPALAIFAAVAACTPAFGFKVETHVWVAQQLINELERSPQITVNLGTTKVALNMRPDLRAAILANKEIFRLGSIGPDALPGIYEGQMTIHPGAGAKGWGTGDWLMHIVRNATTPAEIAFAYGMLIHAASDVFAHTYVNQYAGDIYLLSDGEVDVETRHFLLEGYIAERMPAIRDNQGNDLGSAVALIRKDSAIAVPTDFLRRVFVEDANAARQFGNNFSPHILAIHELNRSLRDLSRKDGPMEKVHILAQQLVIYNETGYLAKEEDLKKINELHQKIHDVTNDGIDRLQDLDQEFRKQSIKALGTVQKAERDALDQASNTLRILRASTRDLDAAERDLAKALDDLNKLQDKIEDYEEMVCENKILNPCIGSTYVLFVGNVKIPPGCDAVSQVCGMKARTRTIVNTLRPSATELVSAKQALRSQARDQVTKLLGDYREAIDKVHAASISVLQADATNFKNAVDFLQRFTKDSDPLISSVKAWLEDNNQALDRYFVANATAISNAMEGGDVLDPLKRWWDCSAPTFMGIPSQLTDSICAAKPAVSDILKAMDSLEQLAVGHDPLLREVRRLKKEVDVALEKAKDEAITTMANRILGVDIESLTRILKTKPTKDMVDSSFAQAPASKKLVTFDRLSDRVDKEMLLDAQGKFDPDGYNVVYNAVVLSKLALLGPQELNQLVGRPIFKAKPLEHSNLMFRFARSIDGNHQWRQDPPPYPRTNGVRTCAEPYGYPPAFALFMDEAMRRKVFAKLFKGPVSPGLETPEAFGMPPALPPEYPYKPTAKNPFPAGNISCAH